MLFGVGALVQLIRRPLNRASWRAALALAGLFVLYGLTASNLLELGENMRFRFETDPLVVAAATALLYRLGRGATTYFAHRFSRAG